MKQLMLIRHASAGYKHNELLDFARTLNSQGREEAAVLAQTLCKQGFSPDSVLCSPAARTVQTLHFLLQQGWTELERVVFLPELYLASPAVLLQAAKQCAGSSIAIIGHNPGISELADHLLERALLPPLQTAGWHLLVRNRSWKLEASAATM